MTARTDDGQGRRQFALGLAAIAAVGLVGRVTYTIVMRDRPLMSDGVHYALAARSLSSGEGFINPLATSFGLSNVPDATHPPIWTVVLAAVSLVSKDGFLAFQITAALVGVGTIVMTGLAAREAFGRRVGLIAAALACVYPGIWLYERELVSEAMGMFGVATLIWLTYRFRNHPGPWRAVALGAVLGICALTRSELIIVSLLVVTPVILAARRFSWGRRAAWLAMAGATTIVVISPWFLHNTTRFAQPVPLSVGLGATMQAGNCGPTYSGDLVGYYAFGCILLAPGISTDPSVADGDFRRLATTYITEHKADFARVAAIRVGRTFAVYAPFQQRELESERGTTMWVLTAALWSFWLLVPLAVYGIVVARRRQVPIYPLLAFFLLALIVVIPTIGAVRYRAMAEVPFVILAGVGINALARRLAAAQGPATDVGPEPEQAAPTLAEAAPVP